MVEYYYRDYKEYPIEEDEKRRANKFIDNVRGHNILIIAWPTTCEVYIVLGNSEYAHITAQLREYADVVREPLAYIYYSYDNTENLVYNDHLLGFIRQYLKAPDIDTMYIKHFQR